MQLQLLDSSQKPLSRPQKSMIQKQRVVPTLHLRLYIGKKLNETSTKKRSYSTWRRTSSIPRHTIGKTSIDRGNRDISTACTQDMSGINITKRIMSTSFCIHSPFIWLDICVIARTTLRRKSCKVTKCGLTKICHVLSLELTLGVVQCLLPGPHRQIKSANVQDYQGAGERRDRASAL